MKSLRQAKRVIEYRPNRVAAGAKLVPVTLMPSPRSWFHSSYAERPSLFILDDDPAWTFTGTVFRNVPRSMRTKGIPTYAEVVPNKPVSKSIFSISLPVLR